MRAATMASELLPDEARMVGFGICLLKGEWPASCDIVCISLWFLFIYLFSFIRSELPNELIWSLGTSERLLDCILQSTATTTTTTTTPCLPHLHSHHHHHHHHQTHPHHPEPQCSEAPRSPSPPDHQSYPQQRPRAASWSSYSSTTSRPHPHHH